MNDFLLYFKMGLYHVLDFEAYDHLLFLVALAVVFSFNQWKKVAWLVTFFTLGHSITLSLAAYGVLKTNISIIEFLIPTTIFITGFVNILRAKQLSSSKENTNFVFALFFGCIHGLGFSNYFKMMVSRGESKILPLLEFALGIEFAQVIIVCGVLVLGTIFQKFLNVSKRDWVLVISAIVIGFSLSMMTARVFW